MLIKAPKLNDLLESLGRVSENLPRDVYTALNEAGKKTRGEVSRVIASELNVRPVRINKSLRQVADRNALRVIILVLKTKRLPLKDFGVYWTTEAKAALKGQKKAAAQRAKRRAAWRAKQAERAGTSVTKTKVARQGGTKTKRAKRSTTKKRQPKIKSPRVTGGVRAKISHKKGEKIYESGFIIKKFGDHAFARKGKDRELKRLKGPSAWGVLIKNQPYVIGIVDVARKEILNQFQRRVRYLEMKKDNKLNWQNRE